MASWEEREAAFWERWWEKDFSWEGQDDAFREYWAEEESRLTEGPNGKHYTRLHLPLFWDDGPAWNDGTPTGKQA